MSRAGPQAARLFPFQRQRANLDVQIVGGEGGVFLDIAEAEFRLLAHEGFDAVVDLALVTRLDQNAGEGPSGRVHGGFLELGRVHLAQALEAAHLDLLALEGRGHQLVAVGVVARVGGLLAGLQPVEGGQGQEQASGPDREYAGIYERFAHLIRSRQSDTDYQPLRIVADSFLCGERKVVAPFED